MEDILRIVRHVGPVVVAWAVAKGWVPATVAGPLTELTVVVMITLVSLGASKVRDLKRISK